MSKKFHEKKTSSKFHLIFFESDTSPWNIKGFHGPLIKLYLDSIDPFIIGARKLEILFL
jgi:hypothetical protein